MSDDANDFFSQAAISRWRSDVNAQSYIRGDSQNVLALAAHVAALERRLEHLEDQMTNKNLYSSGARRKTMQS